jgi:hypothetical protein
MTRFTFDGDPKGTLQEWGKLLNSLDITNFKGYLWTGEIEPGVERVLSHGLKVIPSYFLVINAVGTPLIVRGDTRWTTTHAYVKNIASATTFSGTILVLR